MEEIDDLRLAVDEAGSFLLATPGPSGRLTMTVQANDGKIAAVISINKSVKDWPTNGTDQSLSWKILSGLTDEASFITMDNQPGIRLTKGRM